MSNKPQNNAPVTSESKPNQVTDVVFDVRDEIVEEIVDVATSVYRRLFIPKSSEECLTETDMRYEDGHLWIGLA